MRPKLVVVEDDQSVREMLCAVLTSEGYDVDAFASGEEAFSAEAIANDTTVLLDLGLPGADGVTHCRRLRQRGHAGGVLMLTARHEVADRVSGLDAGADDYLVKPFSLDELLARVRVLVRRSNSSHGAPTDEQRISIGDVTADPTTRQVTVRGTAVTLTRIEFDLLHLLMMNSPAVLSRDVIHERIWGYAEDLASNSLEVFISQLRRKLEGNDEPRLIHTVRGIGYVARTEA